MSAAPAVVEGQSGIRIRDLRKSYRGGRVRALDGVTLDVHPGEAFGVIGPNGAGKTTLMGCLLGFLRPDAGTITIDGSEPDALETRAVTGYLPERLVLDRWMRGADFLRHHRRLAGLDEDPDGAAIAADFDRVGLAPDALRVPVRKYSRGMLQRLGLAQALLGRPLYLYLDEPTSGVDPAGVVLVRRLLSEIKAAGTTIVLNSHQLEQVERVCDRVAFVEHGRVESVQTPEAGATRARVLRVRFLAPGGADALDPGRLANAAGRAGARFLGATSTVARFEAPDDGASARLLAALHEAGLAPVEAIPEASGLERLFTAEGAP